MFRVTHTDRKGRQHTEEFAELAPATERYETLAGEYYRSFNALPCEERDALGAELTVRLVRENGFVLRYYGSEQGGAFTAVAQSRG